MRSFVQRSLGLVVAFGLSLGLVGAVSAADDPTTPNTSGTVTINASTSQYLDLDIAGNGNSNLAFGNGLNFLGQGNLDSSVDACDPAPSDLSALFIRNIDTGNDPWVSLTVTSSTVYTIGLDVQSLTIPTGNEVSVDNVPTIGDAPTCADSSGLSLLDDNANHGGGSNTDVEGDTTYDFFAIEVFSGAGAGAINASILYTVSPF